MVNRRRPFVAWAFLSLVPILACTNDKDLGGRDRSPDGGNEPGLDADDDADDDGGAGTSDTGAASSVDAGGADPFGKTSAGESCNPSTFPAATTSCSIPGFYVITEADCSNTACGDPLEIYQWMGSVTLTGTRVKITDGDARLMTCTLSTNCDCLSDSTLYRFGESGFIATQRSTCRDPDGGQFYYLTKGIRQ